MSDLIIKIEAIIKSIFEGSTITSALKSANVSAYQFYNALDVDPKLSLRYARASQAAAEREVDEAKEIADNAIDPQKARNQIDIRKWRASKLYAQKFGEKIDLNVNGQIDLTAAIEAGKMRALPASYREHHETAQLTEHVDDVAPHATGSEPVNVESIETFDKKRRRQLFE